jgi:hypothetical protein
MKFLFIQVRKNSFHAYVFHPQRYSCHIKLNTSSLLTKKVVYLKFFFATLHHLNIAT